MKYAKLIEGEIYFAPKKIKNGDSITYNPAGETLLPLGYLPVRFTDAPETEVGYEAVCTWEQTDTEIIQQWHIEETEPSAEEALAILMGDVE